MKNLLRLTLLASMALAAFAAHAETYALMIGICDYPDVVDSAGKPVMDKAGNPETNDLSGCVNDVKGYDALIEGKFGVKKENVRMLLDKEANEDGFVKGVKWMLDTAKPGDQVLFFYSGHGTQFDDKTSPTGKQEAIVLADLTLVDGALMKKLAQALGRMGASATFVYDSCFSGGMSRQDYGKVKGAEIDKAHLRRLEPSELKGMGRTKQFSKAKEAALRAIPRAKGQAAGGSFAFIAASSDTQTSADLKFKDDKYPAHGLFTFLLLDALEQAPDLGAEAMVKAVAKEITEAKFTQTPVTEFDSEVRAARPVVLKG